jgi:hypothetical protein
VFWGAPTKGEDWGKKNAARFACDDLLIMPYPLSAHFYIFIHNFAPGLEWSPVRYCGDGRKVSIYVVGNTI